MPTAFALHSPEFYAGDPYPAYRELRATAPVCWNDVTKFWALLRYDDIRFVSTNPALFTSTQGINIPDGDMPTPVQEGNLIFMDPPRHRGLRKLVNFGFTRRRLAMLEPKIRGYVSRLLAEDSARIPLAVEEMLRWNSPVTHMARTATADVEIRGHRIAAGDVVVLLYGSANRDEDVFGPDAEEFKVTRQPNPHIAFGCGEHACVGAQLARMTASVFFGELLRRFPKLELAGEVDRMPATMLPLVTRMPVRFGRGS